MGLQVDFFFTHAPLVVMWVFRWEVSSPPPPSSSSHLLVYLRYRKYHGAGGGEGAHGSFTEYVILFWFSLSPHL